jgi:hypothetical protein
MYSQAFQQGRRVAKQILRTVRPDLTDKLADADPKSSHHTVNASAASAPEHS